MTIDENHRLPCLSPPDKPSNVVQVLMLGVVVLIGARELERIPKRVSMLIDPASKAKHITLIVADGRC